MRKHPPFLGGPSPSVASPAGLRWDCEDASFSPPWRRGWTVRAVPLQSLNEKSDWFHVAWLFPVCPGWAAGVALLPESLLLCQPHSSSLSSRSLARSPVTQSRCPCFCPNPSTRQVHERSGGFDVSFTRSVALVRRLEPTHPSEDLLPS